MEGTSDETVRFRGAGHRHPCGERSARFGHHDDAERGKRGTSAEQLADRPGR
jgi:hypothetical protein